MHSENGQMWVDVRVIDRSWVVDPLLKTAQAEFLEISRDSTGTSEKSRASSRKAGESTLDFSEEHWIANRSERKANEEHQRACFDAESARLADEDEAARETQASYLEELRERGEDNCSPDS